MITVVARPDLQVRDAGTAPVCLVRLGMACAHNTDTLPLRSTAGAMWAQHKRDRRPGENVFPTRQSRAARARPPDMTRGDHRRVDHRGGTAGPLFHDAGTVPVCTIHLATACAHDAEMAPLHIIAAWIPTRRGWAWATARYPPPPNRPLSPTTHGGPCQLPAFLSQCQRNRRTRHTNIPKNKKTKTFL